MALKEFKVTNIFFSAKQCAMNAVVLKKKYVFIGFLNGEFVSCGHAGGHGVCLLFTMYLAHTCTAIHRLSRVFLG